MCKSIDSVNKDVVSENIELEYAGIEFDDVANGSGLGAVFFTQYCPHHCKGCQNQQTWKRNEGIKFTQNIFDKLMEYYNETPFANRLTISGGEPFENLILVNRIVTEFKKRYPLKKVWIYTGYLFEDLLRNPTNLNLINMTDYIVDGKFEIDNRDVTLMFRGSGNQRIVDVPKSIYKGETVLWSNQ